MQLALTNNVNALVSGAAKISKSGRMYSVRNPLSRRARELIAAGRALEVEEIAKVTGE